MGDEVAYTPGFSSSISYVLLVTRMVDLALNTSKLNIRAAIKGAQRFSTLFTGHAGCTGFPPLLHTRNPSTQHRAGIDLFKRPPS